MNFPKNIINLEALFYAIARSDSLPAARQQQLTEIAISLRANPTEERAVLLRELIQSYAPLESLYQKSLIDLDKQYTSQERTKSLGATLAVGTNFDELWFEDIFLSRDWVQTANKILAEQNSRKKSSSFLKRGDRVITLASGGAFLGVLIAQIPGAIVGGLLAGIYAWLSFPTANTDGNG